MDYSTPRGRFIAWGITGNETMNQNKNHDLLLRQQLRGLDPGERQQVVRFVRKLERQAAKRRVINALKAWFTGKPQR